MKFKKLLVLLILGYSNNVFAQQSFFQLDSLQTIEIFFGNSNWDYIMDTAKAGNNGYSACDSVRINGTNYTNAMIKYKGESTYDAANAKNPLHISLDKIINNANYQGVSEIKLGNCYSDASMLREILAYEILGKYMHCSRANFAKVFINNQYYGLFNNAEDIGKQFIATHFSTQGNTIVKANPSDVNAAKPDLTYQGIDSVNYDNRYELKSDYAWKHLIDLCDTLNNNTPAIESILDVDRALWMHAFNNATVNLDSYTGSFRQNYYLIRDNNKRLNPVIWDLNMCFGTFSLTGSAPSLSLSQKQSLSPTLHKTDAAWPLISKLLANNLYYKQYLAHLKTINKENFLNGDYINTIANLKSTIDTAAINDLNKFYTNAEYLQSIIASSTTSPICNGIEQLMSTRANFLANSTELNVLEPSINMVSLTPNIPEFNKPLNVNVTISNANYAYVAYRNNKTAVFTKVLMFDDGNHNDGTAGDNIYGASILPLGTEIQYYFYAQNSDIGKFLPERAEHEFLFSTVAIPSYANTAVTLNECLTNNTNIVSDASGQYEDYIELHNNTSDTIALGNSYLSDKNNIINKWKFPTDAILLPNGYYSVWADEDAYQEGVHCNFKLADSIDFIGFSLNTNTTFTDSIYTPILLPNNSFGRVNNGTGKWFKLIPTYNKSNAFFQSVAANHNIDIKIYPNPFHNSIYIESENILESALLKNIYGQVVLENKHSTKQFHLDCTNVPSGLYILEYKQNNIKHQTKIIKP